MKGSNTLLPFFGESHMPVHNVHPVGNPNVSPPNLLFQLGLLLQVEISIPQSLASVLTTAGQPIPAAVAGSALIDTGATCCCVEETCLQQLNLQPIGQVPMSGRYRTSHPKCLSGATHISWHANPTTGNTGGGSSNASRSNTLPHRQGCPAPLRSDLQWSARRLHHSILIPLPLVHRIDG